MEGVVAGFAVIATVLGFYFLPTIVGAARKRDNILAIGLLNLFLGWTLIGWIIALVWAASNSIKPAVVAVASTPTSQADELAKLAALRDRGILTDEEFQSRKAALLAP